MFKSGSESKGVLICPACLLQVFTASCCMQGPAHMYMQGPACMCMQGPDHMCMQEPAHMCMQGPPNMCMQGKVGNKWRIQSEK